MAGSGDVTWTKSNGTTAWSQPGGDFTAAPTAEAAVTGPGIVAFSTPQLLADVRAMVANPSANHGWILANANETTSGNSLQLGSRSSGVTADWPVLEISYTTQPFPLLYYDFSDGGGTVVSNLGSLAVPGLLLGVAGDERWVTGPRGGALEFDGQETPAGDRISTGITTATLGMNTADYTAAAWIFPTQASGNNMVFGQLSATNNVLHLGVRNGRAHLGHWAMT
jgi:hypothetical protein